MVPSVQHSPDDMAKTSKQNPSIETITITSSRADARIAARVAVTGCPDVSRRNSVSGRNGRARSGPGAIVAMLLMSMLSACAQDDPDVVAGGDVGENRTSISNDNRLALNRLALNRLALNRLALNRLALNGVSAGGLDSGANELLATEEGRELLKYVVQCALEPDDVLVGVVDGQTYELTGLLGLMPKWEDEPLDEDEQRLMSACLLAHVNALGVPVSISLRTRRVLRSTEEERRAYPVYEGTFFGQVFDGEGMKAYSCQGSASGVALAHSHDRELRRCTDGAGDCAIVSLGRCRDICERRSEEEGWTQCWAGGVLYEETVSVYLFADDPYGQNQRCDSNDCTLHNSEGTAAILDCDGKDGCVASCPAGATCTIDGTDAHHLDIDITGAALGEVDCFKGDDCAIACTDQTRCDIECTRSKDCGVACSSGSSCAVDCRKSKDCAVACAEGTSCEVDCYRGDHCQVACSAGSSCEVACGGPGKSCETIECQAGSSCTLSCSDSKECAFAHCQEGASCLLACTDAENCEFAHCAEGAMTCSGGVIVCGRSCPPAPVTAVRAAP
jgi:hypothetical protein